MSDPVAGATDPASEKEIDPQLGSGRVNDYSDVSFNFAHPTEVPVQVKTGTS